MNLALSLAEAMEAVAAQPASSLSNAWAQVFGVADETPEFYMAASTIFGRFFELRMRILEAPGLSDRSKSLFSEAVTVLARFASPATMNSYNQQSISQQKDKIDLLHLASDALPDALIVELNPISVESIIDELERVRGMSRDGDIEPELKRLIDNAINSLLMIIRGYKMFGPDGAARIYGALAAELVQRSIQTPPKTDEGKSALQGMIAAARKVGAALIFMGATVTGADALLTHGEHLIDVVTGAPHQEAAAGAQSSMPAGD